MARDNFATDVIYAADTKGAAGIEKWLRDIDRAVSRNWIPEIVECLENIMQSGSPEAPKMLKMILSVPSWQNDVPRQQSLVEELIVNAGLCGKVEVIEALSEMKVTQESKAQTRALTHIFCEIAAQGIDTFGGRLKELVTVLKKCGADCVKAKRDFYRSAQKKDRITVRSFCRNLQLG